MTREEAKELLPIITAFAEGKDIEYRNSNGKWEKVTNGLPFIDPVERYRIEPGKKYRPFTMEEFLPHKERWVKVKDVDTKIFRWDEVYSEGVAFKATFFPFFDLLKKFTFDNGEPCGVQE